MNTSVRMSLKDRVLPPLIGVLLLFLGLAGIKEKDSFVVSDNISESSVHFYGTIREGLSYVVQITYVKMATASGCRVYDPETDICRGAPKQFFYTPTITGNTHTIHVLLDEATSNVRSWWKPHEVKVCSGPSRVDPKKYSCSTIATFNKHPHSIDLEVLLT